MEPGTPIRCEMTKWGDRPHWEFDGIHLGSDEHGEWLGFPEATHNERPGLVMLSEVPCVTLVPADGWHLATFHAPGIWCDLYVDITTPAQWDGDVLRAVDLDLDVIRMSSVPPTSTRSAPQNLAAGPGETFVDDEDEFAEHQVAYGYPDDVVATARASCEEVLAAVRAGLAPYDGTHRRWLAELTRLAVS
jgi:predicted RNA-binding protein associated with RNAse of E/G family